MLYAYGRGYNHDYFDNFTRITELRDYGSTDGKVTSYIFTAKKNFTAIIVSSGYFRVDNGSDSIKIYNIPSVPIPSYHTGITQIINVTQGDEIVISAGGKGVNSYYAIMLMFESDSDLTELHT